MAAFLHFVAFATFNNMYFPPLDSLLLLLTGSQLELDEETVQGVLAACREEIG